MNNVLQKAVLLRLSFYHLGDSRKGDKEEIGTSANKDYIKLSKVLFKSEEYDAVLAFDRKLADWVKMRAIPVDVGYRGVYILPLALLETVEKRLTEAAQERELLVEKFIFAYAREVEKARTELGAQFRERDYPGDAEARDRFNVRWSYVQFGVPEALPPEIREREAKRLAERQEAMANDVRLALREGLAQLTAHLVEVLTPKEDGARKRFYDARIENLLEFLKLFGARNITDDAELTVMCNRAAEIVKDASPESLRDNDTVRDRVRKGLGDVAKAVDGLVQTARRRTFELD